jgi:hypothetical protein
VLGDRALRTRRRNSYCLRRDMCRSTGLREREDTPARARQADPRRYGYPPDKQAQATQTVLEQAEILSTSMDGWGSVNSITLSG